MYWCIDVEFVKILSGVGFKKRFHVIMYVWTLNDETCIYEQTVTANVQSQGQVDRTLLGLIRSGK